MLRVEFDDGRYIPVISCNEDYRVFVSGDKTGYIQTLMLRTGAVSIPMEELKSMLNRENLRTIKVVSEEDNSSVSFLGYTKVQSIAKRINNESGMLEITIE